MKNKELHIGQLPDLEIVSIDQIKFHEKPNPNIFLNLSRKIATSGLLRNPPIVMESKNKELILLDGANRTSAMKELGIKHLLVQKVGIDDPLLSVSVWHHAVENLGKNVFEDFANNLNLPTLESKYGFICQIHFPDKSEIKIPSRGVLESDMEVLHELTSLYLMKGFSDRVSYTDMTDLTNNYKDLSALIQFRGLSKNDILKAALSRNEIPSGISRILLPKRALNYNISLDELRSSEDVQDKNTRLKNDILDRIRKKSIRFYREPTFVFDE